MQAPSRRSRFHGPSTIFSRVAEILGGLDRALPAGCPGVTVGGVSFTACEIAAKALVVLEGWPKRR
jgi:hypothetical protein